MRKSKGRWLIAAGVLLLIAAAALFAWNKYTEYRAGQTVAGLAEKTQAAIAQQASGQPAGEPVPTAVPDATDASAQPETTPAPAVSEAPAASSGAQDEAPEASPATDVSDAPVSAQPEPAASEVTPAVSAAPDDEVPLPPHPEAELPVVTIDGLDICGFVEVPDLDLHLSVVNEWSYDALKLSPCRFVGTPYAEDLVLLAHNYDTHFGLLKTLMPGAPILFTDMAGNVFRYEVAVIDTLQPTQFEDMTFSDYPLTLFTCTVGGHARVAVRCVFAEAPVPNE